MTERVSSDRVRPARENDEERATKREMESLMPGVQVTGFVDAFREKGPLTQRGFNYADITVIKPVNACHCAATAGPRPRRGPSIITAMDPLRSTQKHSVPWDTGVFRSCRVLLLFAGKPCERRHKNRRDPTRDTIRLIETRAQYNSREGLPPARPRTMFLVELYSKATCRQDTKTWSRR